MAFINNGPVWVGVAMRMADGKLVTYEIDSSHLINVVIERNVEVRDDWEASARASYRVQQPGDHEQVDIRISGIARRWRNYADRDRLAIEPSARAIESEDL